MATGSPEPEQSLAVRWVDVVRFVRQLSHDLRNHLNALELQSAFIGELATDPELTAEIKRLRQMVSEVGSALQKLSQQFSAPLPRSMPYRVQDFMVDFRDKVATEFPKEAVDVHWELAETESSIEIDPQLFQEALLELFANAFQHGRAAGNLRVSSQAADGQFVFALSEPKTAFDRATENWGREPLLQVDRGHYGLGLQRVRSIVESHGGEFNGRFDSQGSQLVTTIKLPLIGAGK